MLWYTNTYLFFYAEPITSIVEKPLLEVEKLDVVEVHKSHSPPPRQQEANSSVGNFFLIWMMIFKTSYSRGEKNIVLRKSNRNGNAAWILKVPNLIRKRSLTTSRRIPKRPLELLSWPDLKEYPSKVRQMVYPRTRLLHLSSRKKAEVDQFPMPRHLPSALRRKRSLR